jgi:hypothetical protein
MVDVRGGRIWVGGEGAAGFGVGVCVVWGASGGGGRLGRGGEK